MRKEARELPLRHAVALGLLHGPTELLPLSSSGHTTLLPWLGGWPYGRLEPELRKSFEVALHAGTAAALLVRPPGAALGGLGARSLASFLLPAVIPPALAGYTLGGQIERWLGTPTTIAAGLLAGSAASIVAELRTHGRTGGAPAVDTASGSSRTATDAGPRDGLALGLAQALALMPGVSRSGATLAAARARGFSWRDSDQLSWTVGLPLIVGAALLKGSWHAREGTPSGLRLPLAAGAVSAFLSTLVSTRVLGVERRAKLIPACAAYRGALAMLVIRRMRNNTS